MKKGVALHIGDSLAHVDRAEVNALAFVHLDTDVGKGGVRTARRNIKRSGIGRFVCRLLCAVLGQVLSHLLLLRAKILPAYFILSGGRYGNEAYIYNGQKWVGTCHYSKNGSYYETVFGKKLRLHENGLTSEFKKKNKEWHPFGL